MNGSRPRRGVKSARKKSGTSPAPPRVSVIVPFFNEEAVVEPFFSELEAALQGADLDYEILAVDDGSSDRTFELLSDRAGRTAHLKVVRLSRNFGHQFAILAGIDHAAGDAVVTIDGDLQDPPSLIPRLVEKSREGYDVVHAVRASREGEPFWRRWVIHFFYRVLHRISRLPVPVDSGDYRLLSRRAADQFRAVRDASPYLRGLSGWVGFRQTTVEYDRRARVAGKSKYGLFKLIQLGWHGVSALSHVPLRMATTFGIGSAFVSFLLGIALIIRKIVFNIDPPGWTSVVTVLLFLGGVQMFMIGVLGEYIGRINDQVKNRPLYVVQDRVNFRS